METERLTVEQARAEIAKAPRRAPGTWNKMLEDLKIAGGALKVKALSRGQAWNLKRTAISKGFESRVVEKGTAVIIIAKTRPPK